MAGQLARRPRSVVAVEHASVLACLGVGWGMAGALLDRLAELSLPALAAALPVGLAAADFLAGAFHFACDRFGRADTPVVGPLIGPFRDHHARPAEITRRGFAELCGGAALGLAPALALGWAVLVSAPRLPLGGFLPALWLCTCLAALVTNQVHAWAHGPAPRAARWLQERGLLLSRSAHAEHHRGAHDRAYCITTGWLNPLLDAAGFWARLEGALRR